MAAPDPRAAGIGEASPHRRRLRVVDDHEVVLALPRLDHAVGRPLERVARRLVEQDVGTLEAVVDPLGDVEEGVLAGDDPPLGVEAGVAHERGQSAGSPRRPRRTSSR